MKVKHSVKLNNEQIKDILLEYLGLPENTEVDFNLETRYHHTGDYKVFNGIELSYETELANVTNKQGSSTPR